MVFKPPTSKSYYSPSIIVPPGKHFHRPRCPRSRMTEASQLQELLKRARPTWNAKASSVWHMGKIWRINIKSRFVSKNHITAMTDIYIYNHYMNYHLIYDKYDNSGGVRWAQGAKEVLGSSPFSLGWYPFTAISHSRTGCRENSQESPTKLGQSEVSTAFFSHVRTINYICIYVYMCNIYIYILYMETLNKWKSHSPRFSDRSSMAGCWSGAVQVAPRGCSEHPCASVGFVRWRITQ